MTKLEYQLRNLKTKIESWKITEFENLTWGVLTADSKQEEEIIMVTAHLKSSLRRN
jgi:hypothetical protein